MKTIEIYCKKCECKLTEELIEILDSNLRWEDETAIMQKKNYVFFKNETTQQYNILVAIDDYYLKNHSDISRFSGCFGSSSFNCLNKVCKNGHEVATEISDCWTAHYIEFDCNKITIKVI
jgi:hypothetical protein